MKEHFDYLKRRVRGQELWKRIIENKLILNIFKAKVKSFMDASKQEIYIIWSASKILVDIDWCFPEKYYEFESMNVKSFKCAELYLVRHYGKNYAILPAEELRRVGINKIDFNEWYGDNGEVR